MSNERDREKRLELLRNGRGLWKDHDDLGPIEMIRREVDRSAPSRPEQTEADGGAP